MINQENLAARAEVQIGRGPEALTLRKVRLIRDKDGYLIYPPQEWFEDPTGRRIYADLVKWSKPLRLAVLDAVRKAYEAASGDRHDSPGEKMEVAGA